VLLALLLACAPPSARAATTTAVDSLPPFPPAPVRAWQTGLVRADRLEHAGASFALASALTLATRDRRAAALATLALGLGKEWHDGRGASGFDPVDLTADALGVVLALVTVRPSP
jgi:hypothetical protein